MDNGGPLLTTLSADGVRIAYVRIGQGRPLVVVGGALYDHRRWLPVARLLSQQATVYVMDRRGRGGSGDAATYTPEREVDDIGAIISAAGRGGGSVAPPAFARCSLTPDAVGH